MSRSDVLALHSHQTVFTTLSTLSGSYEDSVLATSGLGNPAMWETPLFYEVAKKTIAGGYSVLVLQSATVR